MEELAKSELLSAHQENAIQPLYEEIHHNIARTEQFLQQLATDFPKAYQHALTQKSIRMLLNNERKQVNQLIENGVLTEKDASPLLNDISTRADEVNLFNHTMLASMLKWTFRSRKV